MVHFCGVVNCGSRSERDKKSYFRVPAVITRGLESDIRLSRERREKWLSAIRRADLTEEKLKNLRVCADHFITGRSATLKDTCNPDWVPTQNMGYGNDVGSAEGTLSRYGRAVKRKLLLESSPEAHQDGTTTCADEEMTTFVTSGVTVSTQTELTGRFEGRRFLEQEDLDRKITNLESAYKETVSELCNVKEGMKKLLLNEDTFSTDDNKTAYYCGLQDFPTLMILLDLINPYLQETSSSVLSKFQKILLTLMHLRLNLDFTDLGYRFGVSRTTASRIFTCCLHVMYERLQRIVFWPQREDLMKKVPEAFLEAFGRKVTVIIDCFEIKVQKPSNAMASAQLYSNYKHSHTIKYLIGIAPQGIVMFISRAWGGRTSDKHIVQHCGLLENLLPGDLILADRGFTVKDEVSLYCAEIKVPAFTKGKMQLSAFDVESTRSLAHVRIHVERVIGRLRKKFRILDNVMPITLVSKKNSEQSTVDQIVSVCCSLVNMLPSVVPFDE